MPLEPQYKELVKVKDSIIYSMNTDLLTNST